MQPPARRRTARRNFVFSGDVVPRLVGNQKYIETILCELEEESKGNFMHTLGIAVAKPFSGGNIREQLRESVEELMSPEGLLTLLRNYSHCSQLIYYEEKETGDSSKYKFECNLMRPEEFETHYPKGTKQPWSVRFWGYVPGASKALLKANLIQTGSSQAYHNPKSRSKKNPFTTVANYLKDVHNVLPYASECSCM
tara:strand:- start:225 stop:812 length:588 start_codon:yes stop_codon:yes gene_type:complete